MTPPIPIANVYVMMAYAFGAMRHDGTRRLGTEEFDHLHELLAEILIRGTATQIKRGLHRDYVPQTEDLATVRGRIDLGGTVDVQARGQKRLRCRFDEYSVDTPHNRALKSVLTVLVRHGEVSRTRRIGIRRLLDRLDGVTAVPVRTVDWSALSYHRANASYRMLLGTCELLVRGLLHGGDSGDRRLLTDWMSDEALSGLFERFVRQYFTVHHPDLRPGARVVHWDHDPQIASGAGLLPQMRTDIVLTRGSRSLIIDTKFYARSMQSSRTGKDTVHSAHLYQILSYVKNFDTRADGSVSGLLLYARTTAAARPHLDVTVQGNRIAADTLDLALPWPQLRGRLDRIPDLIEPPGATT